MLTEVQFCVDATVSHGRFSAYQNAFGSKPEYLYTSQNEDRALQLAQYTSISGQFCSAMEAARSGAGRGIEGNCEEQTETSVGAQPVL